MPGMAEEEWMRVGDEISLIRSLFGFTDLLLEMRKLMTMTRRMMRAMPVMQPEMMYTIKLSSKASRTVDGREAADMLPCLRSAWGAGVGASRAKTGTRFETGLRFPSSSKATTP